MVVWLLGTANVKVLRLACKNFIFPLHIFWNEIVGKVKNIHKPNLHNLLLIVELFSVKTWSVGISNWQRTIFKRLRYVYCILYQFFCIHAFSIFSNKEFIKFFLSNSKQRSKTKSTTTHILLVHNYSWK